MANILPMEKKIAAIHALCEGTSIRAVERLTGVHRDTIMRLGVNVGNACNGLMDAKFRNLNCQDIQVDEIWSYSGCKQRNVKSKDPHIKKGDAYIYVAIDRDTKLVPCHLVGKRTLYYASMFMEDLAGRLAARKRLRRQTTPRKPTLESSVSSSLLSRLVFYWE